MTFSSSERLSPMIELTMAERLSLKELSMDSDIVYGVQDLVTSTRLITLEPRKWPVIKSSEKESKKKEREPADAGELRLRFRCIGAGHVNGVWRRCDVCLLDFRALKVHMDKIHYM